MQCDVTGNQSASSNTAIDFVNLRTHFSIATGRDRENLILGPLPLVPARRRQARDRAERTLAALDFGLNWNLKYRLGRDPNREADGPPSRENTRDNLQNDRPVDCRASLSQYRTRLDQDFRNVLTCGR